MRDLWPLRRDVLYLNHGSFGACPRPILERQSVLREEMEREPVDFLSRELPDRLRAVREETAAFVSADPAGLAFVPNATAGVNAVLRSLALHPGDEILETDHGYAACRKATRFVAERTGAVVTTAAVPFPVASEDEIVSAVLARAGPRTRLAVIDHVTSPTALVFPIERIVREFRERGIETLVDGAHALGMVPLDLDRIGAAYYTANAHKWLCAPKGAAILWVRADLRSGIHPPVVSHGYDPASRGDAFLDEFDWTGTFDPTAWLVLPDCIRLLGSLLPGGWPALMERNRALAREGREDLARALGVEAPCPDSMLGAMASLLLPSPRVASPAAALDAEGLTRRLRERGIEAWFHRWPCAGGSVVRISAQLYNARSDYAPLAESLREAGFGPH